MSSAIGHAWVECSLTVYSTLHCWHQVHWECKKNKFSLCHFWRVQLLICTCDCFYVVRLEVMTSDVPLSSCIVIPFCLMVNTQPTYLLSFLLLFSFFSFFPVFYKRCCDGHVCLRLAPNCMISDTSQNCTTLSCPPCFASPSNAWISLLKI